MAINYGAEGQQNNVGNKFSFRQALQVTAAVITSPLKATHSGSTPSKEFVSSLESIAEPGCPRLKFIKNRFEESTNRSPLLYTLGCLLKLNMLESQRKNGGIRAINWFRAAGIVLSAPFFLTGDNVQVKYTHFNNQTGATEEGYRTRHNDRGTLR